MVVMFQVCRHNFIIKRINSGFTVECAVVGTAPSSFCEVPNLAGEMHGEGFVTDFNESRANSADYKFVICKTNIFDF